MKGGLFFLLIAFACVSSNARFVRFHRPDFDATEHRQHTFMIAIEPNRDGVETVRRYILDHSSNVESRDYGNFLTTQQLDDILRPGHTSNTITDLRNLGIDCQEYTSTSLKCRATGRAIERVFENGVPDHLSDRVNFAETGTGMSVHNEFRRILTKHTAWDLSNRPQVDPSVSPGYISREVMLRTYLDGETGKVDGSRVSAGAIEFLNNEGFNEEDMMIVQNHSCTSNNPVSRPHILGYNSPQSDGESELDMAVVWQASDGVDLWYQDYDGWIFGWASYMSRRNVVPQVVSLSWGWDEDSQCITIVKFCNDSRAYVDRANIELMRLAARGMTILVSSGDAGSPGRTNEGCDPERPPLNPVFPGGSEWVTSVGATYIKQSNENDREWTCPISKYLPGPNVTFDYTEGVTTWRKTGWTSGSGFSNYSSTPEWQREEVESYLSSPVDLPESQYFNRNGRAYPDVAAFGHNCAMYQHGTGWTGGDGTSCSAPMFAGVITYLNDYQLSRGRPVLGFANPLLYKMRREDTYTFNDVSEGDSACTEITCCEDRNFGFLPAKGAWDPLSGLGTPRVKEIKRYLDSLSYSKTSVNVGVNVGVNPSTNLNRGQDEL